MARVADRGAVRRRMLMNDLRAKSCVDGAGDAEALGRQQERHLGVGEGNVFACARDGFTHSPSVLHSGDERLVHSPAGFFGHSERSVDEPPRNILRRRAESRNLVIVNRARPIHREMSDDASLHQVDEQRRDTGFHYMSANHHDDGAPRARRVHDRGDNRAEVGRNQNVGKAREESTERTISARRTGKLLRANLVRPELNRNCPNPGEVGFRNF